MNDNKWDRCNKRQDLMSAGGIVMVGQYMTKVQCNNNTIWYWWCSLLGQPIPRNVSNKTVRHGRMILSSTAQPINIFVLLIPGIGCAGIEVAITNNLIFFKMKYIYHQNIVLTHKRPMAHVCAGESGYHSFRQWIGAEWTIWSQSTNFSEIWIKIQ